MPDAVECHVLAQIYHQSPLVVEQWPHYQRQKYLNVIGEIRAGQEYRQELEKFKQAPNDRVEGNDDNGRW